MQDRRAGRRSVACWARRVLVVAQRGGHRDLLRARASSARGSCGPPAARRPAPGRRPRTRSGSRRGWSASTASGRRGSPRPSRRRRPGAAPRPARPPRRTRGSTRRRPGATPRSRHQSTTLRRCSTGSTRPVGLDGELSQTSAGVSRAERGQRVRGHGARTGERRADVVRRVGELGEHDRVAGTEAEVHGERADQLLGADDRQDLVEAEAGRRRGVPSQSRQACRVSSRPTVSG